jgi:hypothetical protein
MEETWNSIVRKMKDESESPQMTQRIAHRMFYDIPLLKFPKQGDKVKFKQRMGAVFVNFLSSLELDYPEDTVAAIVNDDAFWEITIARTLH